MITVKTTFGEIKELEHMKQIFPYLVGNGEAMLIPEKTIQDIEGEHPTWAAQDMVYGLQRLEEICLTQENPVMDVYSDTETLASPDKRNVKLMYFPAEGDGRFVILMAGGAYGAVCSLAEAFPVAAKLNELGISAFCLNYRVGMPDLLPKPMEDLAASYQYICARAGEFHVDPSRYAVGGFSAGGHVAAAWGTQHLGYRRYKLEAPEMLMLVYPLINPGRTTKSFPVEVAKMILSMTLGEDYTQETLEAYTLNYHVDSAYPPAYLVHNQDDGTVPVADLIDMMQALEQNLVSYKAEKPEKGGHGFGLGSACEAAGWVERAVRFWKSIAARKV